jgi:hypothetical protein
MSTISTTLPPPAQPLQATPAPAQTNAPSLTAQQTSTSSATKTVESKSYKNADGTYGPKHTLRSPASITAPANESDSVGVNVKV